jgi:single-strand DNA-binding protein
MFKGINKVILIGHLGRDPQMRYFPDGTPICQFSVATSETWKDKQTQQQKQSTEWHKIVLTRKLAEIGGQYLKKGSKVYVEGNLTTRKWQNQLGQDQYTTEVRADYMQMLSSAVQQSLRPGETNARVFPNIKPEKEISATSATEVYLPVNFEDDGDIPF